MSLLKFLFASTAIGSIALTAPVVFSAGKMFGKIEERKNSRDENSQVEKAPEFMHKSESTQWSKPFEPTTELDNSTAKESVSVTEKTA